MDVQTWYVECVRSVTSRCLSRTQSKAQSKHCVQYMSKGPVSYTHLDVYKRQTL